MWLMAMIPSGLPTPVLVCIIDELSQPGEPYSSGCLGRQLHVSDLNIRFFQLRLKSDISSPRARLTFAGEKEIDAA